jgi:hypothetical protein
MVWRTVNVTLDPALRKKVLEDSLHSAQCPNCKQSIEFQSDLLYHDMDRQFMISLVRSERGTPFTVDTKFLERAGGMTPKHRLRFVTSYNQLREKILIFEAGLNDFAVELLKMLVWEAKFSEKQITDDSMYFCAINTQTPEAPHLTFECYEAGKPLAHTQVPYCTYAQILTNPKAEKLRAYRLGEWIQVNQSNLYEL